MLLTINKLVEEDKVYHSPVLQVRDIFHNLRLFLSFQFNDLPTTWEGPSL